MVGPLSGIQHFCERNHVIELLASPSSFCGVHWTVVLPIHTFLVVQPFAATHFLSFLGEMFFPSFLNTGISSFRSATYLLVYV
jgi:hypothetical protein